jgi:hypothetical protein
MWQSLKTSHLSVAQAKLAEFLKEHRERVSNGSGEVSAKMTFGEAAAIHLRKATPPTVHETSGLVTSGAPWPPKPYVCGR